MTPRRQLPVTEGNAARVYAAIEQYLDEHGYPPTVRELSVLCGITSTSVVSYHLWRLVAAGAIERDPGVSRGIRVVKGNGHES